MDLNTTHYNGKDIPEVISQDIIISNYEDALDLLGSIYYQGYDGFIIHKKNIHEDFFDLSTKMAGDILQKFSNYRMKLAIIGDFSQYQSKSLKDFIFESNKSRHINFVSSIEEAFEKLE